jgi:N-methylhydantoinase A
VTDAQVAAGRIPATARLAGDTTLDAAAARAAVAEFARGLSLSPRRAAIGIIEIANAQMARALRRVSVEKGLDVAGATLVAYGGAGGLHAAEVAALLGMQRVVMPPYPGAHSALGLLLAPVDAEATWPCRLPVGGALRPEVVDGLMDAVRARLAREGVAETAQAAQLEVDLRYCGQSEALAIPWDGRAPAALEAAFHAAHAERNGVRIASPIECVAVRARGAGPKPALPEIGAPQRVVVTSAGTPREYDGSELLPGPAAVLQAESTIWIPRGWTARGSECGCLVLSQRARAM